MMAVNNCKEERLGCAGNDGENRSFALPVLHEILDRLSGCGIPYVVIHGREALSGQDVSDIDLAFADDPRKILLPLLREMQAEGALKIIQVLHYDVPACYYFILAVDTAAGIGYIHLDCLYDRYGVSRYMMPSVMFLNDRREADGVFVPAPEVEATYLLIKKTKKNTLSEESLAYIRRLTSGCREETLGYCEKVVDAGFRHFVAALLKNDCDAECIAIGRGRMARSLRSWYWRHPVRTLHRVVRQTARMVKRFIRPSGVFVVLLGPDGSGKSTIADRVLKNIGGGFRRKRHFHWRPGVLPRLGGGRGKGGEKRKAQDVMPSLEYKYGVFVSLVRYTYYLMDFIIGGSLGIGLLKRKTTVVLAERYYYDYFVHPARYAFRLPMWVFRLGFLVVRKPDLLILLDNDPETIWSRKKELPLEEIKRQIRLYREIVSRVPFGCIVQTGESVDSTAEEVVKKILDVTARKNMG